MCNCELCHQQAYSSCRPTAAVGLLVVLTVIPLFIHSCSPNANYYANCHNSLNSHAYQIHIGTNTVSLQQVTDLNFVCCEQICECCEAYVYV